MNWKVGDVFIIVGPEEELQIHALDTYKGTKRIVTQIGDKYLKFQNPVSNSRKDDWYCPIENARPLTKLDKALK